MENDISEEKLNLIIDKDSVKLQPKKLLKNEANETKEKLFSEALLKKELRKEHSALGSTQYDVKIGDGMDIAIHGENGTFY